MIMMAMMTTMMMMLLFSRYAECACIRRGPMFVVCTVFVTSSISMELTTSALMLNTGIHVIAFTRFVLSINV